MKPETKTALVRFGLITTAILIGGTPLLKAHNYSSIYKTDPNLTVAFASPSPDAVATSTPAASPEPSPSGVPAPTSSPNAEASIEPVPEASTNPVPMPPATATTNLFVNVVSPTAEQRIAATFTDVELKTTKGADVALDVNGQEVPTTKIGKATVYKDGTVDFVYYGVDLQPGENSLTATSLGAGGIKGSSQTVRVYGPDKPSALSIAATSGIVADGQTPRTIRITAKDRWGYPAGQGSKIRVTISGAQARMIGGTSLADSLKYVGTVLQNNGPTNNVRDFKIGIAGYADIPILPGTTPGVIHIHAEMDSASADADIAMSAQMRPAMVVGVAQGGVGNVPAVVGSDTTATDGQNAMRGRVGIFATGAVTKTTALTFAYESTHALDQNSNQGQGYVNPLNTQYATYGDGSITSSSALSEGKYYARLDNGTSSLLYGEFTPNIGASSNAQNATGGILNGVDLNLRAQRASVNAFSGRNGYLYGRVVIPLTGLAGIEQSLHPNILVGTDLVNLVVLDRASGAVVSETPLVRNVDYVIDYVSGELRFLNPPLPYDGNLNPQSILIQYQYDGATNGAETNGGRAQFILDKGGKVVFGGGYLNQIADAQAFSLVQQDLNVKLQGGALSVVHASSSGEAPNVTGDFVQPGPQVGGTLQVNYRQALGNNVFALAFQDVSPGYINPFGGFSTAGLRNYTASIEHNYGDHVGNLRFFATGSETLGAVAQQAATQVGVVWQKTLSRLFSANLGLTHFSELPTLGATPAPSNDGTQAIVGIKYDPNSKTELSAQHDFSAGGQSVYFPTGTTLQAKTKIHDGTTAYGIAQFNNTPYQPMAGGDLTAIAGATHSFAFGLDHPVGQTADVGSRFEFGSGTQGAYAYSLEEAKKRFVIGKRFTFDLDLQKANGDTQQPGFMLYGANIGYDFGGMKFGGSVQDRTGANGGLSFQSGIAGTNVHSGTSILATIYGARTPLNDSTSTRVGIAFRPPDSRGAGLFEYDQQDGSSIFGDTTQVISTEGAYDLSNTTSISARAAYKLDGSNSYYLAHTSLFGIAFQRSLGGRFDLDLEGIATALPGTNSTNSFGTAGEVNYRLSPRMRVGVGYAFSKMADPSLSSAPKKGVYFSFTTLIDQIFGWGRNPH